VPPNTSLTHAQGLRWEDNLVTSSILAPVQYSPYLLPPVFTPLRALSCSSAADATYRSWISQPDMPHLLHLRRPAVKSGQCYCKISVNLVDLGVLVSLHCTANHELESTLGSPVGQWQSTRETPCARGDLSGNHYAQVGHQRGPCPALQDFGCSLHCCAVTSCVLR